MPNQEKATFNMVGNFVAFVLFHVPPFLPEKGQPL